jgi:hypothetical protein
MTVTFTLTTTTTDAGPFNISGTTSGGASNGVSIATGVTKVQLLTGHTITNIGDTITGGTIASTGTCTTTDTWSVTPPPTPTPTSTAITPTPTAVVFYSYQIGPFYTQANIGSACNGINGSNGAPQDFLTEVYAATDVAADVTQFFTNTSLTNAYGGSGQYHAYYRTGGLANYTGQVSPSGFVTDRNPCIAP